METQTLIRPFFKQKVFIESPASLGMILKISIPPITKRSDIILEQ